jgi:hypothetical protein
MHENVEIESKMHNLRFNVSVTILFWFSHGVFDFISLKLAFVN